MLCSLRLLYNFFIFALRAIATVSAIEESEVLQGNIDRRGTSNEVPSKESSDVLDTVHIPRRQCV